MSYGIKPIFSREMELNQQLHAVQKNIATGLYPLDNLGSIIPASVMLHDLIDFRPNGVSYMNNWGCERLGTSVDEINSLGADYYEKYFVKEEVFSITQGIGQFLQEEDFSKQFNFFQRVKLHDKTDYMWFYTVCKLLNSTSESPSSHQLVILSSPVDGIDHMIRRINKVLDEDIYIKNNYRIFSFLTKQEKRIITLLTHGKSSKEIADELFISIHTVTTHRRNIIRKTGCKSFAALFKFAMAFDLHE